MSGHFHTYDLDDGRLTLFTTTADDGSEHTHKTITPDGRVVVSGPPVPMADGGHVHAIAMAGGQIKTAGPMEAADFVMEGIRAMRRRMKKRGYSAPSNGEVVRFGIALSQYIQALQGGEVARTGPGGKPAYMISADAPRIWVDAVKVGELAGYPSEDGSGRQITEEMIDAFVRNLNASPDPIPVDGGQVSDVHGTPYDTATHAAGWAHQAEKRYDADNVAHMWLELELSPEVYDAIKKGRLKYGSSAYVDNGTDHVTGEPIGPELDSYALTNKPFVKGLQPHMVLGQRAGRQVRFGTLTDTAPRISSVTYTSSRAGERRLVLSPSKEVEIMSKDKTALASLPQVQKALLKALEIPDETPPNEIGELVLMKVVEWKAKAGITPQPEPEPPADDEGADLAAKGAGATTLAEDDAMAGAEAIGLLRAVFNLPEDADAAAVLEALNANLDKLKAAMGGDAPEPDAGPGDQPADAPAMQDAALSARVKALETALSQATAKLEADEKDRAKTKATDYVVRAFSARGLRLDDSAKETFVAVCLSKGEKAVEAALSGIKPIPPAGQAMPAQGTPGGNSTREAAIDAAETELRTTRTDLSPKALKREAILLAARKRPDLFTNGE